MLPSHFRLFVFLAATSLHAADFECRWAATPPKIDGVLDDAPWKAAQVVTEFASHWLEEGQRKPPTAIKARLLWDREFLYFSAEMEDWDVFANVTQQDGFVWTCDVFELFFKPAQDKPGYYEFEVNAANGKLDMFLPSRGSGGYGRHKADRQFHIESAVKVRGTLNNFGDKDKGWTVEARMPWSDFTPTGGRPAPGEVWQHALCRYDYSAGLTRQALSSNALLTKPDFHNIEDYAPLRFIGPHEGAEVRRPLWQNKRLVGSPEPPLPFRTTPAFPTLKTTFPIMIKPEPGRPGFIVLESNGYVPVRKARVLRVAESTVEPEVLLELDESLYDLCFHPQFEKNGFVYLGANGRAGEGKDDFHTRVLRYTMDRQTGGIDPASRLSIIDWWSHGHNGASLTFGKDGMLYVTAGDGGNNSDEWSSGQDMKRLLAKLLRIDVDHPAGGRAYGIPQDNPFLHLKDTRPETWAFGFRNPWRMTMDRETGDLWVGENGQDLWEYARVAKRGENYGWPVIEGTHDFHQHRERGPAPITKALIEHSHTDFRSLTGGIVYRGSRFKELHGCYIYGDYSTGQIWAARHENGRLVSDVRIADTALAITAFCETNGGDILVVDYTGNAIHRLEPNRVTVTHSFPTKLSETGLLNEPALLKYDINTPAWHDGATSERHIALPGDARMEFADKRGWTMPDGTAVMQTLTHEGKKLETRVLLKQQNEWAGYSYAWNDVQTDATLVSAAGETRQDWRIPSRQECMLCHSREAGFLLGVSTVQLNRDDQIANWERQGLVGHTLAPAVEDMPGEIQRQPVKNIPLLPVSPETLTKLGGESVEARARAYLHANCSHCHVRNGGGNSVFQLASHFADMEIMNANPMHGDFGLKDAKVIAPGAPERSLLIYRTVLRGPGQMPPIGTRTTDGAGVALLVEWVQSLKP